MMRYVWRLLAAAHPQIACGESSAQNCRPDAPGVREIREVATGIVTADNHSDIERVLAYYSADAVLTPPAEAPVVGRDRALPRYESLFADFTPAIEAHIDEACVEVSMGFVRGHNGGRQAPRVPGEARMLDDDWMMLLRFEAGGCLAHQPSHLAPAERACGNGARGMTKAHSMPTAPMKPALIIIDMQQGMSTAAAGSRNNPGAEKAIATLLATWRAARAPIAHVRHISNTRLTVLARPGRRGVSAGPGSACKRTRR
jgi:hypothetical protein